MKSKISILIAVLMMAFASCKENDIIFDKDDLDMRVVAIDGPVINIHVPIFGSMKQHLNLPDLDWTDIDGQDVICVKYSKIQTIDWTDKIIIKGENGENKITSGGDWNFNIPLIDLPNSAGMKYSTTTTKIVEVTTGDETDAYFTLAELSKGMLKLVIDVPTKLVADGTLTINELLDSNGAPYVMPFAGLKGDGCELPVNPEDRDISGYTFIPDESGGKHFVNMVCDFTVEYDNSASTTANENRFGIELEIYDMDVSYIEGYFGKMEYKIEDDNAMEFNLFEHLNLGDDGEIGIKDVSIELNVINPVGVPAEIKGHINFANNDGWSEPLLMTGAGENFDVNINAATHNNRQVTPGALEEPFNKKLYTKSHSDHLDPSIYLTKENLPTRITFDVNGYGNPNGDIPKNSNFAVNEGNEIAAKVEVIVTVPLHIKVKNFVRTDTIGFNFREDICNNDESYSEKIEYVDIKLEVVKNEFPFDLDITLIPIGANDKPLKNNIIHLEKETIDGVEHFFAKLTDIDFLDFWDYDVKNFALQIDANTQNEDYVKITKEHSFIDISFKTNIKAPIPSLF